MKAEEYIESVGNTVVNGKAIVKSDFIPKNIALKAVEMARKEEREKAIKAFCKVTCRTGIDIPCEYCSNVCKINEFVKLLNE